MSEQADSNRMATSMPMILAQRVLDLLEDSGATPQEQKMALDIVRPQIAERAYAPVLPTNAEIKT